MPSTKDIIIEALKGLGIALCLLTMLCLPFFLKAFKTPYKPKLGHGTPFGITKPNQNQK